MIRQAVVFCFAGKHNHGRLLFFLPSRRWRGEFIRFIYDSVSAEDKVVHGEFVAKYDGKDYPVTGDPGVDAVVLTKIDPNTVDYVWKKLGKVTLSEKEVVSKDGKTSIVTTKRKNAKGQDYTVITFWEKQ